MSAPSSPAESCPSAETLAMVIDGTAPPAVREALMTHMAGCEDCYVAFTEAARSAEGDRPQRVVAPRRIAQWSKRLSLPLAAAAVLALAVQQLPKGSDRPATSVPPPSVASHTDAPPSAALPPGRSPLPAEIALPGWLTTAPWWTSQNGRMAFAPTRSDRRAVLLGIHLAALEEGCLISAPRVRDVTVRQVSRSAEQRGLLPAATVSKLPGHASSGECSPESLAATIGPLYQDPIVVLGRQLEGWRIAVARGDEKIPDRQRGEVLRKSLTTVPLGEAERRVAARIVQEAAGTHANRDQLQSDITDLLELLCL